MESARPLIVLLCVTAYMVACVGFGLWAMKRTKDTSDFFMAGRHLGAFVTSMAVFSSTLSGFGFVGGPGLVYRMGMSSMWMVICVSIGYALSFFLLGKRLRIFAEVHQPLSLPDVVATRYGSETTRFLVSVAILFGVMAYLASQILAMATVLQILIVENTRLESISIGATIVISCAVLVFYCVTGGIIASVYTDVFQGVIMIVAAVLIFATAANTVDGGFTEMSRTIMTDDPEAMGPWGTLGMMGCLCWYFVFTFGGAGQPQIITKMMMNRRITDARYILPISLAGFGISALLWLSIGLVMRTLVLQGEHAELSKADDAVAAFLQVYAHPILAGVVFAGLFAAIMSTADGFLNVGTAALIHDIPTALGRQAPKNELFWARVATVLVAVAAGLFARYSPFGLVALLGKFGWGIFASAITPTVAIGFNWKRATAGAASASIVCALVVNLMDLALRQQGVSFPWAIDGSALAFVVSLIVFFGVSLLSRPPVLADDVKNLIDM